MSQALLVAIDLVAVGILTFGLYFRRHHRRDLVVAFLGVNVGVLAVSMVLGSSTIGAGLGLGLFGVLSIIRLRSDEIAQHEVAYYFSALALGLLAGLTSTVTVLTVSLMALILVVMFIGDNHALFPRYRQQTVVVDRAYTDEAALTAHLEQLLGGRVRQVQVKSLDLVNDTTLVDVRFQVQDARGRARRDAQESHVAEVVPSARQAPSAQPAPLAPAPTVPSEVLR
ncbi:DUF4956 domain-containing protein [Herbiconiux moechotypicola]|uniref:DUF4956 domain-containing protein n=1 Tax=Herbiconiux moechotypicola TaxID=637393 RepID=A0ABN3DDN8_9MICO|nr:DUF4956 domain-containing protein [Herbiconiux moechotypicola]MCS5729205.1 DUF4956 domain-containing protein [Herbiconiux moechotypicola]